jgi:hypothetical protein
MDLSDLLQQFGGGVTAEAPEGMDIEGQFGQVAGSVSTKMLAIAGPIVVQRMMGRGPSPEEVQVPAGEVERQDPCD